MAPLHTGTNAEPSSVMIVSSRPRVGITLPVQEAPEHQLTIELTTYVIKNTAFGRLDGKRSLSPISETGSMIAPCIYFAAVKEPLPG